MKNIFSAFILLLSVFIFLVNCSPRYLISKKEANDPFYGVKLKTEPMIIFNERFAAGGYTYTYPDTSADSYLSPHTQNAYKGEFSLKIGFDKTAHSGIGIVFSPVDVAAAKKNMTLEFWVKGVRNNVTFAVELIDSESDGKKTGATVPVSAFCRITTNWQKVSIPLNK
ncbi:MAG TPA: hypothetical protein VKS21_06915, partial [Spirochaetota bacterium]|nr:hypothetical protein [Spirochaetota bacterium]